MGMTVPGWAAGASVVPLLRVDDVFKIYRAAGEEAVALRGASLEIGSGESVALVGRSGSGKSTLLHLIAGLDAPSAGRIYVRGTDITQLDDNERALLRAREMGVVMQRGNLIPYMTALENVALPLRLAGETGSEDRARTLLRQVGLADRMEHRAGELSGGEEQRVSIALALAPRPHLLLADEVTGELDSATAGAVLDLLFERQQGEGMSLLLVTHDEAVATRAGRVIHMRDGVVLNDG